jgi:hypothetical protein
MSEVEVEETEETEEPSADFFFLSAEKDHPRGHTACGKSDLRPHAKPEMAVVLSWLLLFEKHVYAWNGK